MGLRWSFSELTPVFSKEGHMASGVATISQWRVGKGLGAPPQPPTLALGDFCIFFFK